MRLVRLTLALGLMSALIPMAARAQASIYGEFSASDLHNLSDTQIYYGGTAGLLVGGFSAFSRLHIQPDIQGRFVNHSGGERLDGLTLGPRFSVDLKHGLSPYGEFMLGFARYNSGQASGSTTDATIQLNAGLAKRVSPRFDVVADYSYSQYYALGGEYNPKTFSVGGIFHLTRR